MPAYRALRLNQLRRRWTMTMLLPLLVVFGMIVETESTRAEIYVTEAKVQVDRCASAWFIKRFLDADATFAFFESGQTPPKGISYDFYGAKYFHKGPDCTFTTLIKTHKQTQNKALQDMNQLVNDAFAWMQAPNSLGAQLRETIAMILEETGDDHATYKEIFPVFDLLYHQLGGESDAMLEAQKKISQDSAAELKNNPKIIQQASSLNKPNTQKRKLELIARIKKDLVPDEDLPLQNHNK